MTELYLRCSAFYHYHIIALFFYEQQSAIQIHVYLLTYLLWCVQRDTESVRQSFQDEVSKSTTSVGVALRRQHATVSDDRSTQPSSITALIPRPSVYWSLVTMPAAVPSRSLPGCRVINQSSVIAFVAAMRRTAPSWDAWLMTANIYASHRPTDWLGIVINYIAHTQQTLANTRQLADVLCCNPHQSEVVSHRTNIKV